jgi:hypothetical protein
MKTHFIHLGIVTCYMLLVTFGNAAGNETILFESTDGRTIQGQILKRSADSVLVQRSDGQTFEIPLSRLTAATLTRIQSTLPSNGEPAPVGSSAAQTPPEAPKDLIPAVWDKTKPPETWDKTTTAWLHFRIEAGEQDIDKTEIQRKFDELQEKLKLSQRVEDRQRRAREATKDLATSLASGDLTGGLVALQLQYAYFEWSEDKKSVEFALPIEKAYCSSWPGADTKVQFACQDVLPLSFGAALSGQQHNAGEGRIVTDITLDGELQAEGTVRGKLSGMLVFKNTRFSYVSSGAPVLREVPFVLSRVR